MQPDVFTEDYRSEPYWWEGVPRPVIDLPALPARVDVAVVGSGYTGLHAALQTARGGRSTLVLESGEAGAGCSTRNGGQISTSIKPGLGELSRRLGPEKARADHPGRPPLARMDRLLLEGRGDRLRLQGRRPVSRRPQRHCLRRARPPASRRGSRVRHRCLGRLAQRAAPRARHGALSRRRRLSRARVGRSRTLSPGAPRARHVRRGHGGDRTARRRDRAAGQRVRAVDRAGQDRARDVVIATNGYTGNATPWLMRRVIPIGSYMIATEPLAPDVMARVMPTGRIVSDTRKVVYYYRAVAGPPAHPVRRPGQPERDRSARQRPAPARRDRAPLSRAGGRAHQPFLDGLRRLHLRHARPRRRAGRHALRDGLLRLGGGHGELSRHADRPTDARAWRRRDRPRSGPVPDAAVLHRKSVVPRAFGRLSTAGATGAAREGVHSPNWTCIDCKMDLSRETNRFLDVSMLDQRAA